PNSAPSSTFALASRAVGARSGVAVSAPRRPPEHQGGLVMLKDRPLHLLERANPASVDTAGEFASAINLHERVLSSIARQDARGTDSTTSSSSVLPKRGARSRLP